MSSLDLYSIIAEPGSAFEYLKGLFFNAQHSPSNVYSKSVKKKLLHKIFLLMQKF